MKPGINIMNFVDYVQYHFVNEKNKMNTFIRKNYITELKASNSYKLTSCYDEIKYFKA